jgi:hypothetical protein
MNFNYLLAAEQLTVTANPLLPKASWFTNSMLVTIIVTGLVLLWARRSTKKMTLIPEGAQNLFEALIETLYLTFEGVVGKHMMPKVFSLFATLFICRRNASSHDGFDRSCLAAAPELDLAGSVPSPILLSGAAGRPLTGIRFCRAVRCLRQAVHRCARMSRGDDRSIFNLERFVRSLR